MVTKKDSGSLFCPSPVTPVLVRQQHKVFLEMVDDAGKASFIHLNGAHTHTDTHTDTHTHTHIHTHTHTQTYKDTYTHTQVHLTAGL